MAGPIYCDPWQGNFTQGYKVTIVDSNSKKRQFRYSPLFSSKSDGYLTETPSTACILQPQQPYTNTKFAPSTVLQFQKDHSLFDPYGVNNLGRTMSNKERDMVFAKHYAYPLHTAAASGQMTSGDILVCNHFLPGWQQYISTPSFYQKSGSDVVGNIAVASFTTYVGYDNFKHLFLSGASSNITQFEQQSGRTSGATSGTWDDLCSGVLSTSTNFTYLVGSKFYDHNTKIQYGSYGGSYTIPSGANFAPNTTLTDSVKQYISGKVTQDFAKKRVLKDSWCLSAVAYGPYCKVPSSTNIVSSTIPSGFPTSAGIYLSDKMVCLSGYNKASNYNNQPSVYETFMLACYDSQSKQQYYKLISYICRGGMCTQKFRYYVDTVGPLVLYKKNGKWILQNPNGHQCGEVIHTSTIPLPSGVGSLTSVGHWQGTGDPLKTATDSGRLDMYFVNDQTGKKDNDPTLSIFSIKQNNKVARGAHIQYLFGNQQFVEGYPQYRIGGCSKFASVPFFDKGSAAETRYLAADSGSYTIIF